MPHGHLYDARSLLRLGTTLVGLRRRRGLTQAQLAEKAGVSRQWLIAAEKGQKDGLEIGKLMVALDALGASLMIRDDLDG
ncbi:helix-turn-helix domain-containing protein [Tessaracoccus caeni]|uniref:helix-turn-helix domain-containing protein n=1 Tax=Tessaracoccus caeni TaxID=3031239 RepID=UPI0023DA00D4|nr:helix-turn-helix domain-containing protein [Tessaracoccus caeni]MDF1487231.1 helix-turn-helix domain-containing protein [Tessaracoccus caeni]